MSVMATDALHGFRATDRPGDDDIEINEGPPLDLTHPYTAVQAYFLKVNFRDNNHVLKWVTSNFNLVYALTEESPDCR